MSGNLSKNNNTELKIPQSLETTEGSAILPSLKQEAASIPAQLPEKLEINLSKSIYDSSRSIPKVIEATGVLTLGGLFYLFAGESGFNTYLGISNKIFGNIWGGATFENIASMNDKQLEENLNPLHHLSKVVEPIIQPLNLLSRQATDRLNFYGYNVYLRSTGSSQVTFEEYQIRKIDPENWELRAGENTLYALEALGIAYLMVTRGGLAKSGINLISKGCVGEANFALLLKEGSDLLTLMRMPVFMSALSSIGDILDRKEDPKNPPLISLDTCYQCVTGITNGTFDSLVFMSFISAVSKSVVTFESIRKAKAVDYSQHMQKVVSYTEAASEATDISEGLPDFYKNCENSKAKLLSAIFSPSGQTWQELIGASLKLVASALDLVDRKQSGESRRLAELPSNLQQTLQGDRTLAEQFANIGKVVASEHGDILFLEDAGKVSEFYQRRAEVLRYKLEENLFSFTGLKSLLTSPSARLADYFTFSGLAKSLTNFGRTEKAKIAAASKNVSAFFDPELGLTVAALPKTEIEKERYLGYSAHEAIHREISQLGLEEFLETDTGSRLSDKIQNYMGVNLENLLSESHGRLRAEELLAHLAEYEVLCGVGLEKLEDAGITIPFLQHENLYFNDYHRILDFVFKNYGDSSLNEAYSHFLLTAKRGESGLTRARRIGGVLSANSPVTLATGIDFNLADVPRFISQRGLETQIKLLERLLPLLGYKKSDIKSYFELLNAEKSMFLQRLASHPHPLAVALGASSPLAISDDSSIVLDVVNELAVLLTDSSRKCGLVVGNSTTGFTEAFSSSWASTSERANGREYMQQTPIFRIPLAWDVTDIAEGLPQTTSTAIDSTIGLSCPPHLLLVLRTIDFLIRRPALFLMGPSGLGSDFEIAFLKLEAQLRKTIFTSASAWKDLSPVYLLDYRLSEESIESRIVEYAEKFGISIREARRMLELKGDNQWFYQGLINTFRAQLIGRTATENDLDFIHIVRVGKGKNIDGPGFKVLYFKNPEAAAAYVANKYDQDVKEHSELSIWLPSQERVKTDLAFKRGEFNYIDCFSGKGGFLEADANEEKHMMAEYMRVLALALRTQGIAFTGSKPIHWLEPGIGDGSTTLKIIKSVQDGVDNKFVIHGSDIQEEYGIVAVSNLREAAFRGEVDLEVSEIWVEDAFSGEPLSQRPCDIAMFSHFIYHILNDLRGKRVKADSVNRKVKKLISGVMESLNDNGIILAFHEGPSSDMFGKIGFRFGGAMHDATERIAKAAKELGHIVVSMPFESKLYFPKLSAAQIARLKDLKNWSELEDGSPEASWVKKLLFALHNIQQINEDAEVEKHSGVIDLARQLGRRTNNETRLGDLIDYMVDLFRYETGEERPFITIRSEMQAILKNPKHKGGVKAAFAEVKLQLPNLRRRARMIMRNARNSP